MKRRWRWLLLGLLLPGAAGGEVSPCLDRLAALSPTAFAERSVAVAARAVVEEIGREAAGEAHEVEARSRELLAAARAAGDYFAEACAYEQLGNAAFYLDEVEAAIDAFRASLKRLEALGDLESQAYRLKDLGVCYRTLGRFGEALEVFEEARLLASRPERFGAIHFASHALIDPITPRRSALLLTATAGDDGFLQAREIARLELSASLVVLAACRGARDRAPAGGGVHGLALSFFHAGADAVAASLWAVDDRITTEAMGAFYRQLAAGAGKASALRHAQLELLERYGLDAPRHWAPWLLFGDPFGPVPMSGSGRWRPSPPSPLAAVALGLGCLFAVLSLWRLRIRPISGYPPAGSGAGSASGARRDDASSLPARRSDANGSGRPSW